MVSLFDRWGWDFLFYNLVTMSFFPTPATILTMKKLKRLTQSMSIKIFHKKLKNVVVYENQKFDQNESKGK